MKKGEVRKLVIPADEGYGAGGFPAWGIPPGGEWSSGGFVLLSRSVPASTVVTLVAYLLLSQCVSCRNSRFHFGMPRNQIMI
jgi:hypothetical protein